MPTFDDEPDRLKPQTFKRLRLRRAELIADTVLSQEPQAMWSRAYKADLRDIAVKAALEALDDPLEWHSNATPNPSTK